MLTFMLNNIFLKHKNQIDFASKIISSLRHLEHIFVSTFVDSIRVKSTNLNMLDGKKTAFFYINQKFSTSSAFVSLFVN
jgi:hypothetical protein